MPRKRIKKTAHSKSAEKETETQDVHSIPATEEDGKKNDTTTSSDAPVPSSTDAPVPTTTDTPVPSSGAPIAISSIDAPIPRIDVSVLKKKKSLERMDAERKERRDRERKLKIKERDAAPRIHFLRPEQLVRVYRQNQGQSVRLARVQKARRFFSEPTDLADPKLALVVRIRGIHGMTTKIKKLLSYLRLRHNHTAAFVQLTPNSMHILNLLEPFVTYGFPNLKTIRELVTKRGYTKINGQRVALTDNTIIEDALGNWNVVCLEDIVHEVFTCGPAFKHVNKFLSPFKLNNPHGGFPNKRACFMKGGDAGSRGEKINPLLQNMI